jgi:hypothetical protein
LVWGARLRKRSPSASGCSFTRSVHGRRARVLIGLFLVYMQQFWSFGSLSGHSTLPPSRPTRTFVPSRQSRHNRAMIAPIAPVCRYLDSLACLIPSGFCRTVFHQEPLLHQLLKVAL